VESAETKIKLSEIPLGGRLLVRSRADWRVAAVSRIAPEMIVLTVASPGGRNYRIRRDPTTILDHDGMIPVLTVPNADAWRSNFSSYDLRW
jgi:hypothetical protein